jgi:hypothetical protein
MRALDAFTSSGRKYLAERSVRVYASGCFLATALKSPNIVDSKLS